MSAAGNGSDRPVTPVLIKTSKRICRGRRTNGSSTSWDATASTCAATTSSSGAVCRPGADRVSSRSRPASWCPASRSFRGRSSSGRSASSSGWPICTARRPPSCWSGTARQGACAWWCRSRRPPSARAGTEPGTRSACTTYPRPTSPRTGSPSATSTATWTTRPTRRRPTWRTRPTPPDCTSWSAASPRSRRISTSRPSSTEPASQLESSRVIEDYRGRRTDVPVEWIDRVKVEEIATGLVVGTRVVSGATPGARSRPLVPHLEDLRSVKLIGLGGVGGIVARYLVVYLGAAGQPVRVVLIDGDDFEARNAERMLFSRCGNKAAVVRDDLPRSRGGLLPHPLRHRGVRHLGEPGPPDRRWRRGPPRRRQPRHPQARRRPLRERLADVCLISGGNDGVGEDSLRPPATRHLRQRPDPPPPRRPRRDPSHRHLPSRDRQSARRPADGPLLHRGAGLGAADPVHEPRHGVRHAERLLPARLPLPRLPRTLLRHRGRPDATGAAAVARGRWGACLPGEGESLTASSGGFDLVQAELLRTSTSRILYFWILPVTVIGNSSTTRT